MRAIAAVSDGRPIAAVAFRSSHALGWSGKLSAGSMLIGFGLFSVVEGIINQHVLGLHRVEETVPGSQRVYRDVGSSARPAV